MTEWPEVVFSRTVQEPSALHSAAALSMAANEADVRQVLPFDEIGDVGDMGVEADVLVQKVRALR